MIYDCNSLCICLVRFIVITALGKFGFALFVFKTQVTPTLRTPCSNVLSCVIHFLLEPLLLDSINVSID
uniref:Uncharacterized protein n=1 Tax=Setaria italica TaxID=4555 RepID=K4AN39_SETIT